ncbi:ABC transporter ATP-binding protein [Neofamilia massiliensis]|uniref:ABC transporter ATP-binding protein n=1 Tax=Neofamilia massiliensis TaxID=1673724 RepID=UPI0006BB62E2|nr:ABC transporter ATP-binding protein [Neofamilia massiliensis]
MKVLQIENLSKSFGDKKVLKDVSFDVNNSEIVGFLGKNGAGKSTTMKIICGLLSADSGRVEICGHDIKRDRVEALKSMGVSIEAPALYDNLTGRENLKLMANWRSVDDKRVKEMEEYSRLGHNLNRLVKGYSMGMKMRLMLAMVLMAKPKLLILDEPMNGLDPDGVFELREEMKKLKDDGCSILFSSHQLAEVEKISDRIVMIENGQVVYNDKFSDNILSEDTYNIVTDDLEKTKKVLEKLNISYRDSYNRNDEKCLNVNIPKGSLDTYIENIKKENIAINDIDRVHKTLEELYKELRKETASL